MRRTIVTLVVAAIVGGPVAAAFAGPEVPTTMCELQRFLGYENVRECEDADS